jgi:hypothetical protein
VEGILAGMWLRAAFFVSAAWLDTSLLPVNAINVACRGSPPCLHGTVLTAHAARIVPTIGFTRLALRCTPSGAALAADTAGCLAAAVAATLADGSC